MLVVKHNVGDFFVISATFSKNWSSTSENCYQHKLSPTVTDIDDIKK